MPPVANGNGAPVANGNGHVHGNGNGGCANCDVAKAEAEAPAEEAEGPPVYLLERSLRDTWLGKTMADHNLKLYGWTAMSYTPSTNSISNLPMTFNDRAQQYQMNQNWIHFEKGLDTSKKEFQWGFVTDSIVPGTDYRFTTSRGLFDEQLRNGPGGTTPQYGFDLFQAYTQAYLPNLGANGTTVQFGKFATIVGYELVQAPLTPFVSKSYLFQYNPFTHTGVFASTGLSDTLSVGYGAVLGADNFIDSSNRFTFLGQLKWTPKDSKFSAIFNTVLTDPTFIANEPFARYNVYNAVLQYNVNDCLTYVLDTTYSHMNGVPGVGFADWYGAANYLIYKVTDKLTTTLRAEVFEDSQGVRTGFAGLYTEVTAGLAWSPCDALTFRPSFRYDTNSRSRPFEGDSRQWTGAFEMIFRW